MKRPLLLLSVAALCASLASCKTDNKTGEAANNSQPSASPVAEFTPPPGAIELSESSLQKDIEKNPEDADAHFTLGELYLTNGKYLEAAGEYKFVVGKNPKDVEALKKMGIAYAAANKPDEAIDAFKRAVALAPKDAELRRRLSDVYEKAGKTAEAARERGEFGRLQPNERAKELYRAGKYEETIVELQKVASKNAETYGLMGATFLKLNQTKEAVSALRQAVRMNPKHADAFFQLGNAYDKLGQPDEAAKAFTQAVRLNPSDADAYFNLGNEQSKLSRHKEAAQAYAQAVKLKPDDADARFRLGVAHLRSGNLAGANEQLKALKSLKPEIAEQLQQQINQSAATK
ncbi:MAG TPA: tetratricopeptide repeat protein [Pyrinomonadaceae bacterium]|nr:tetratricopeptide repeat protein [Pyrinomonadaceae bacterium]